MPADVPLRTAAFHDPGDGLPRRRWRPKVIWGLLGAMLAIVVTAAVVAVYAFRPHVVRDPAQVAALAGSLLDIDVPPEFRPRGTIEWNVVFLMSMQGAYYDLAEGKGRLMLIGVDSRYSRKPRVRAHIERVLREEGAGQDGLVRDAPPHMRDIAIRGEPVPFSFQTFVDPATKAEYRQIEGVVDGQSGQVLVALRFRGDGEFTDDRAVRMLESIR